MKQLFIIIKFVILDLLMLKYMMKKTLILLSLLMGCASPPKPVTVFTAGEPFNVKAAVVESVFMEPVTLKKVRGHEPENDFQEALNLWTVTTFVPNHETGTLFVTFDKAILEEIPLTPAPESTTLFSKRPTIKLKGTLHVHLDLKDAMGHSLQSGHMTVERSKSFVKDSSFGHIKNIKTQLFNDLIGDLDQQVRQALSSSKDFIYP